MGSNEVDSLEIVIEAEASKAGKELDKLISKLTAVSSKLGKINTSTIKDVGTSSARTGKELKNLSNSMGILSSNSNKTKKSFGSFAEAAGKFYVNCFLIIRGIKKIGSAIEKSMDYVETFNYWNVSMDKIGSEFGSQFEQYGYDSAESYADSFSSRMKDLTTKMTGYSVGDSGELTSSGNIGLALDPEQLMNYQSSVMAVTNSIGLAGETSVNTAKALSMLSADMSSFKNVDLSTVMTNFQSGLIGQSRAERLVA